MKILILDDLKSRHLAFRRKFIGHELKHVYTAKECIRRLHLFHFDAVFLDHDLGEVEMEASGPGTGFEVAEWLSENPKHAPDIIMLHTLNTPGAQNMRRVLAKAGLNGIHEPFLWKE